MKLKSSIEKNVVWGMLFIALFSSLFHFLYNISGESTLVALIAPVNESVWEHLKMPLLPTTIWWVLSYYILRKNHEITLKKWLFSGIISFLICISFIILFYYTYTGAFGIHSVILDILSLLIGIFLGQKIALHIYKNANLNKSHYIIVFVLFFVLLTLFIVFTFNPPHLPIFKDNPTGKYGING